MVAHGWILKPDDVDEVVFPASDTTPTYMPWRMLARAWVEHPTARRCTSTTSWRRALAEPRGGWTWLMSPTSTESSRPRGGIELAPPAGVPVMIDVASISHLPIDCKKSWAETFSPFPRTRSSASRVGAFLYRGGAPGTALKHGGTWEAEMVQLSRQKIASWSSGRRRSSRGGHAQTSGAPSGGRANRLCARHRCR